MTNQKEIIVTEHNVTTGEVVNRPATEEEKVESLRIENEEKQYQLNIAREQEELTRKQQTLLTRLGLTKEEFDLLVK